MKILVTCRIQSLRRIVAALCRMYPLKELARKAIAFLVVENVLSWNSRSLNHSHNESIYYCRGVLMIIPEAYWRHIRQQSLYDTGTDSFLYSQSHFTSQHSRLVEELLSVTLSPERLHHFFPLDHVKDDFKGAFRSPSIEPELWDWNWIESRLCRALFCLRNFPAWRGLGIKQSAIVGKGNERS